MEIHFLQPNERVILQTSVQQYLRDLVNSEMFWQDFCRNVRVTSLVKSELNERVPRHVRDEVPRHVKDYLSHNLDTLVSREIMRSLPGIVANNYQMQKLLEEHANSMKAEIQRIARQEVDKIVNEEQYHVINQRYFEAFNSRAGQHLSAFENRGNRAVEALRERYDRDLSHLKADLKMLSDCGQKVKEFEDQVWWLQATIFALSAAVLGGFVTVLSR